VVSTSITLETAILKDELDIAVMLNPLGDEKLLLQPLGQQPTTWAVPAAWDLSGPVSPRELWLKPVISNPPPSAMYRQITSWFATAGLAPGQLSICTSVAVIAELVVGGIGAGLLPIRMAERYAGEGSMRLVGSDPPVENGRLYIGFRKGLEDAKATAVARTIVRVLDGLDYLLR
jgi:DNA-binding transcriptional LysR family regulator